MVKTASAAHVTKAQFTVGVVGQKMGNFQAGLTKAYRQAWHT
ncbi:hypothetical protein [Methylophilus sp. 3sh_L]